jgi:hypothetical protein
MKPRSWNTHAILTRATLEKVQQRKLRERVLVVCLDDFLAETRRALPEFLRTSWSRLALKTGNRPPKEPPDDIASPADFVRALRLNPTIGFPYVRLMLVNEVQQETPHDMSREGPPDGMYVPTAYGESLEILEVIATFSDEPDWGMDQDLFPVKEYQYGPCPFGPAAGESSQAPFHMAFLHENPILTMLFPGLRVSFMEERIRTFFDLSKLAFQVGIDYWGWRFSAWAMHYLQDLTQPYHAGPFPVPLLPVFKRLAKQPHFEGLMDATKDYLKTRHLMFEATVHFLLNHAAKRKQNHLFFEALRGKGEIPVGSLAVIMGQVSKLAKRQAKPADRALADLMNMPSITDLGYSLGEDPDFRIDLVVPFAQTQRPQKYAEFLSEVALCLEEAGKVTRYAILSNDRT